MTSALHPVPPSETDSPQITRLFPGDAIEITLHNGEHHRGKVDDVAPAIGIVWIRDCGTNERRLFHEDEVSSWFAT